MAEKYECADCGKVYGEEDELQYIHHITERVLPGDEMPAGQCPDCGALCFVQEDGLKDKELRQVIENAGMEAVLKILHEQVTNDIRGGEGMLTRVALRHAVRLQTIFEEAQELVK